MTGSSANTVFSEKIFISFMLIGIALIYAFLFMNIYIDTKLKVSLIEEAYSMFEYTELLAHSQIYLPYYLIYIFLFPLYMFVTGTSYPERLKIILPVLTVSMIFLDIGSMWAIRYVHAGIFSLILFGAGSMLGLCFITVVTLLFYDIWIRNNDRRLRN